MSGITDDKGVTSFNIIGLDTELHKIGTPSVYVAAVNRAKEVSICSGATKPTDNDNGYAKGCLFIKTNGGLGTTLYINEGDSTDCDFNAIGSGGSSTFIGLTDVPAAFAGSSLKPVRVNVGETALEFYTPSLVNADIDAAAAIAWSKLAVSTDISTAGKVTDLTLTGEVIGDVAYFDGTNWVHLAATALPAGTASTIAQSCALEAGAFDLTLATTTQTAGIANLTIPDFAGVSQVMAFIGLQQTLTNKILTDSTVYFGANGALTKMAKLSLGGATAGKATTLTFVHTDDRAITFPDATDTLVGLATTDTLTNKTLTDTTCIFGANGALTKTIGFDASALTAGNKLTLAAAAGTAQTLTLPNATDTLVGKATADVFTNKTFDCDGAGNVLSNVSGSETDPIAVPATEAAVQTLPVLFVGHVDNEIGPVKLLDSVPFKMMVVRAWSQNTSADGGTWKLQDNGSNDITDVVTAAASDNDIDNATQIDDSFSTLTAGQDLYVSASGTLDAYIFVEVIRVD
jgi:hypothetical protein